MNKYILTIFFSITCFYSNAQLGFCTGSKGDPIFQEDFGNGVGTGNALGNGVTTYRFVRQDPQDGEYTIADDIGSTITSWHDYLPETTNSGGRALIVNADFNPGKFYEQEISGLCENTTYEFSAFLLNIYNRSSNVCVGGEIPNNVKFEIWDETNSFVLKSGNTGDIFSTTSPRWEQYALTFQSEAGQDAVILKMYNNGEGGCGNDLAIDDITFSSCGDFTEIISTDGNSNSIVTCEEDLPVSTTLTANPDFSVYENHFYQWQESSNSEDWVDIPGATNVEYETNLINTTTFYRVKVAEDAVNLATNECSSASDAFEIKVVSTPSAPVSLGDVTICGNENLPFLEVTAQTGNIVNWYDQQENGNLLAEATNTYSPDEEGIFYAEAVNPNFDCSASSRTAVRLSINTFPEVNDEFLQICPSSNLTISAGVSGYEYLWSTGEITEEITISDARTYFVEITTAEGCSITKTIEVAPVENAQLSEINSQGENVIINPEFEGAFLYSLDGINFQESNIFNSVAGGIYTAYIKDMANCNLDFREFAHLVIPDFITPNNDGINDSFQLNGIEFFDTSEIRIFDRYGKLLKIDQGTNFKWNGEFEGVNLPADDYWYQISIEGFENVTGHFSLIR